MIFKLYYLYIIQVDCKIKINIWILFEQADIMSYETIFGKLRTYIITIIPIYVNAIA